MDLGLWGKSTTEIQLSAKDDGILMNPFMYAVSELKLWCTYLYQNIVWLNYWMSIICRNLLHVTLINKRK